MRFIRLWSPTVAAFVGLAGCAPTLYAPAPGIDPARFPEQSSLCDGYAHADAPSFVVSGRPLVVGAALIVGAVVEGVRERHRYQDCMAGTGWVAVDSDHAPPPGVAVMTPDREPGSPVRPPLAGRPQEPAAFAPVAVAPAVTAPVAMADLQPPPIVMTASPPRPVPAAPFAAGGSKLAQCQLAAASVRPGTEAWFMDLCMK
jgi:hypothetical protein